MTPQVSRRTMLSVIGATAGGLPLAGGAAASPARVDPFRFYLGAYSGGDPAHGIGVASADEASGALALDGVVPTADPSFLALSAGATVLYAANEKDDGGVTAFAVADDGTVGAPLGSAPSGGAHPCHLAVHPAGGHLFTANYGSGTVGVVALGEDGAPGEVLQVVQHTGSGPDPDRQEGPHAHQVVPVGGGERLFAVDLGTDSVHLYAFDAAAGRLTPEAEVKLAPGSGPRHLVVHPGGRTVYVLGELDSTLTACAYDAEAGTLTPGTAVATLPDGTSPEGNFPAAILVSSDGRFVYASNRGHDSVAVFSVEGDDEAAPRLIATHPCGGAGPRHMILDAAGTRLYIANQTTGSVAVLDRDPATGALSPGGGDLGFARVSCVLPAATAP
ncbi:lactonase family protein [Streptomyces radicis]|uniref:Lactonase family protein n=1 Tax=Streptomyces radicis TaxID=1750517 RepID=A0A3A9WFC0_9ACTN|nr:lactonase family protein [Streptomyces radicis]RKN04767.1 lactonase family protein [Streptomyces radicis]RKN15973.1 lactonase family protein [Streptomyces radicis]